MSRFDSQVASLKATWNVPTSTVYAAVLDVLDEIHPDQLLEAVEVVDRRAAERGQW